MADDSLLVNIILRSILFILTVINKKHLKNVGPIRHCEPPYAATVARRLRIDVHDNSNNDNDNA